MKEELEKRKLAHKATRKSLRYLFYRNIWIYAGQLNRWASRKMLKMLKDIDRKVKGGN